MKLKPFKPEVVKDQDKAIDKLLRNTGVKRGGSGSKLELDEIREIFSQHGAGVEEVAQMTGTLIRCAGEETTKLRAGELALKVAGIFNEIGERPLPVINITIVGSGNNLALGNKQLVDLVCPASPLSASPLSLSEN